MRYVKHLALSLPFILFTDRDMAAYTTEEIIKCLSWKHIFIYIYVYIYRFKPHHYGNVVMSMVASQFTSLAIVYSTVYSGVDQSKYQRSASLAFVRGIHRWPVNSPHKGTVTWKMFPFDDVIMLYDKIASILQMKIQAHKLYRAECCLWDKVAGMFANDFLNVFSWMKIYEFRLKLHWSLFLRFSARGTFRFHNSISWIWDPISDRSCWTKEAILHMS